MKDIFEKFSDKELTSESHSCKNGERGIIVKNGYATSKDGNKYPRYKCKLCGETFYEDGKRRRISIECNDIKLNKLIMHLYIEGFKPCHIYEIIKNYQMRDEKSLLEYKKDRLYKFKAINFQKKVRIEQHMEIKTYVHNFISCIPQNVRHFVERLKGADFEVASINCNYAKKTEERTLYKLFFEEKESQVLFGFSTNDHDRMVQDAINDISENMEANRPTEKRCNECDKFADAKYIVKYRIWKMLRRRKFSKEKESVLNNLLKNDACFDKTNFDTHYFSRKEVEEFNRINPMPYRGYIKNKKF